jgi:acid phosphatase
LAAALLGVLAALGAGCGTQASAVSGCPGTGRAAYASRRPIPHFRHVIVIVFENTEANDIFGSFAAPTFNELARRYAKLTRYCGVAHPSLPNYLALVSGSTQGLTDNCDDCRFDARNLADSLEAAHRSWKSYAEGLPSPGYTGGDTGPYIKHHNPFVYFRDVLSSRKRLERFVPVTAFARDLAARALPDFALVVTGEGHNMSDGAIKSGDSWLHAFVRPLLALPGSVVFVTFDEGDKSDHAGGGGHVATLVLGPLVRPHSSSDAPLSHYSLLRTIEDSWQLPRLGRSASAAPIRGIWR